MQATDKTQTLVFIVDDDALVCKVLNTALKMTGYETRVFEQPEAAIQAMSGADRKPAILITDFRMPGMNGLELIQKAKALLPGLKSISISAQMLESDLEKYQVRPDAMLRKPLAVNELLEAMSKLIGGS